MVQTDPKTVLVIEDDLELLDLVAFVLEDEGYRVEKASDGLEGLRAVERKMPDLIILDMKMPVMNGWQFASEFKARYNGRAPIVVLTAGANARRNAEEIGAQGWIGKPFELDELVATVRRFTKEP